MKKLLIILLLALVLSGCTLSHDPYSKRDIWGSVAFHTLNIMDYAGTDKSLHDFPGDITEGNSRWFGTDSPSRGQLIATALLVSAIYEAVIWYTPQKYRWWIQVPAIGMKAYPVVNNWRVYQSVAEGR